MLSILSDLSRKIIWSVEVGTFYPRIGLFDDDSLKSVAFSLLSPFPSVLRIPLSTIDFHHHPPCPCSISSAHSGMVLGYRSRKNFLSFPPGQQRDVELQPSSLLTLSNQLGWRGEGNRELRVEGEPRGAAPCAWKLILFICWSFSISIPPPALSDWYWVTGGSEESIPC